MKVEVLDSRHGYLAELRLRGGPGGVVAIRVEFAVEHQVRDGDGFITVMTVQPAVDVHGCDAPVVGLAQLGGDRSTQGQADGGDGEIRPCWVGVISRDTVQDGWEMVEHMTGVIRAPSDNGGRAAAQPVQLLGQAGSLGGGGRAEELFVDLPCAYGCGWVGVRVDRVEFGAGRCDGCSPPHSRGSPGIPSGWSSRR